MIFESRWGRSFSPTMSRSSPRSSKGSGKSPLITAEIGRDHDAFSDVEPELFHLFAEGRPRKRRVNVDDVSARAVGDRSENIAASQLPFGENAGKRRVNRNAARDLGLGP
jgi:hypothetical protein